MSEQMQLFGGFGFREPHWVPVELIDAASAEYTLARELELPRIDIDFEASPGLREMQAAYALKQPISLVSKDGQTYQFMVEEDLDYTGWLDSGVHTLPDGNVDVSAAPDFVFYRGRVSQTLINRHG